MSFRDVAYRGTFGLLLATGALFLGGCTYEREGPPELHFVHFKTGAPKNDTVTVCSAHGCQHQTPFTFAENDIRQIATIMANSRADDTAEAEREAIGEAIAWIERRVGAATGTDRDRPGLDILGSGDRSQQDCVDEATNTTSYLMVMERYGMFRHHKVARPFAKGNMILGKWVHWGAMVEERATGKKYAVDSFFYANGEPPVIMAADRWYIDDTGPAATPGQATAVANAATGALQPMAREDFDRLLERVLPRDTAPRQDSSSDDLTTLVERVLAKPAAPRPAAFGYARSKNR